jgi:hypothetical protein
MFDLHRHAAQAIVRRGLLSSRCFKQACKLFRMSAAVAAQSAEVGSTVIAPLVLPDRSVLRREFESVVE